MNSNTDSKCDVCELKTFDRNNYFYGKQLTVRDFLHEQRYLNEKRWLINRMILGWGVVCGLKVYWDKEKREFIIEPGLAIDCCGHEIVVDKQQVVELSEYKEWCEKNKNEKSWPLKAVLCLEYFECNAEQIELPPLHCDDKERVESNRRRESFKLRFRRRDEVDPKQPYGHDVCFGHLKQHDDHGKKRDLCDPPPIHQHLCEHLAKGCPKCSPCPCVVLATVTIPIPSMDSSSQVSGEANATPEQEEKSESCEKWPDPQVDPCTDRRLVYNNTLLYDLIHCHHGDLPHIVKVNWFEHKRQLTWEKFGAQIQTGLIVTFDKEVKPTTLDPDGSDQYTLDSHTFFVSFTHKEVGTGNFVVKRIPGEAKLLKEEECWVAKFCADPDWQNDELQSHNSELAHGVDVEITLRGSRIHSSEKKALDGEFDGQTFPTGNGVQGGDFVDWFHVLPRGATKKAEP